MIAQELEVSLHMAFMDARQKRHELITVEHLLLAMIDNPTAAEVLRACGAKFEVYAPSLIIISKSTRLPLTARMKSIRSLPWAFNG